MYRKHITHWQRFSQQGILAKTDREAEFLANFIRLTRLSGTHIHTCEVIDLQRYRLIRDRKKVQSFFRLAANEQAFLFPVFKN